MRIKSLHANTLQKMVQALSMQPGTPGFNDRKHILPVSTSLTQSKTYGPPESYSRQVFNNNSRFGGVSQTHQEEGTKKDGDGTMFI